MTLNRNRIATLLRDAPFALTRPCPITDNLITCSKPIFAFSLNWTDRMPARWTHVWSPLMFG